MHLKLNELIASSNRLVDIGDLAAEELITLNKFYVKLSDLAEEDDDLHKSHALDEANGVHREKLVKRNIKTKQSKTIA